MADIIALMLNEEYVTEVFEALRLRQQVLIGQNRIFVASTQMALREEDNVTVKDLEEQLKLNDRSIEVVEELMRSISDKL